MAKGKFVPFGKKDSKEDAASKKAVPPKKDSKAPMKKGGKKC